MTAINFVLDNLGFFVEIVVFMLIYRYITSEKIKLRWYIIVPLLLRSLFVLIPPIAYVMCYSFLIVYSIYKNRYDNRWLSIFYGLFPIVIESIIFRIIAYSIALVVDIDYIIVLKNYILNFVTEISVFPVFFGVTKVLKMDFDSLNYGFKKSFSKFFLWTVDISMFAYFMVLQFLIIFGQNNQGRRDWIVYLVVTYALLFLATLVYINATFSERLKEEVLLHRYPE